MKPYLCAVCGEHRDAHDSPPTTAPDGIGLVCEFCDPDALRPQWPVLYRGFQIMPSIWGLTWSHVEYDGPEDRRIGSNDTVAECKLDIDEWCEANEPAEGEPAYWSPEVDR